MRKAIIKKENLKYNIELIKKTYEDTEIIGVVKANAYGHGAKEIASFLYDFGVKTVAVVTIEEAQELLELDIDQEVIVLGPSCIGKLKEINNKRLIQLINSKDYYEKIKNINVRKQLNINTGMNRLGISYDDPYLLEILKDKQVEGSCTHFLDNKNITITENQINKFKQLINEPLIHTSLAEPQTIKENNIKKIRVGTSMYGYEGYDWAINLKPIMTVYGKIINTTKIAKGESVSYSAEYIAEKDMTVGTVAFGYSDGLPFTYKNGYVFYNNHRCKILGRITMDFIMVDLTDVKYKECEYVEIIGENITASEVAAKSSTITYDTLVKMGKRVKRIYQ